MESREQSTAYRQIVAADAELAEALRTATEALSRVSEIGSLMLSGSIPMGAFSRSMSDIDLVGVTSRPMVECDAEMQQALKSIRGPHAGKVGVLLLDERCIRNRAMRGIMFGAADPETVSECEPHEIDMIMFRKYSVLLFGRDYRPRMVKLEESDVIADIVEHVIGNMLPPLVESIRRAPAPQHMWTMVNSTFVMSRCLFTLSNSTLTTKPKSAKWLLQKARDYRSVRALAGLAAEFAHWYEHGQPDEIVWPALCSRFIEAAADFPAAVAQMQAECAGCRERGSHAY